MKKVITIAFLFVGTICFSQKKSDTLIVDFSKYKFIKIGDRVYKIESPVLSEIKVENKSDMGILHLKLMEGGVLNNNNLPRLLNTY